MTEEDYFAGIDWLERVNPDHALIRLLRLKYSPINCIYLKKILEEVGERPKERVKRIDEPLVEADRTNPAYRAVCVRISNLMGLRRKLSNKFHTVKSDAEAAVISLDIGDVQNKLAKCYRQRREFLSTGVITAKSDVEEENGLPSGVALTKAMNANCKRRSYTKNQIREHAASKDPMIKRKVDKWNQKLKEDELEYELLKRALAKEAL